MHANARLALTLLALAGVGRLAAAGGPPATPRPIVITVDDLPIAGPHDDLAERKGITERLLAALRKHRVPAVGFVTWKNLRSEKETELRAAWLAAGHELGNHTVRHLSLTTTPVEEWIADAENARARLAAFVAPRGGKARFFRFPFLNEGETREKLDAVRAYLDKSGQRNLPVTLDDQDWSFEADWVKARKAGDAAEMSRIGEEYRAALRLAVRDQEARGDALFKRPLPQVLLLHANEVGAAQWDALFTWLEATGHRFATADEVLADPAFAEPHQVVAHYGYGLWDRLDLKRRISKARDEVMALLTTQAGAWNRGDMAAFCSVYVDDALFLTPSGVTRGRQTILERYLKRYPDAAARGTLSFEILSVTPVHGVEITAFGDARPGRVQGVSVAARWTIAYAEKPPASGLTLLNLRPEAGGWRIVEDASM
ncbi:MAG TPA: polysaccharide deacetylase family protein [Thermoanaerobaculia bacterium]|nr:polysaccharide deacetylase family protein [Thermoanaerobaculia bacterium]